MPSADPNARSGLPMLLVPLLVLAVAFVLSRAEDRAEGAPAHPGAVAARPAVPRPNRPARPQGPVPAVRTPGPGSAVQPEPAPQPSAESAPPEAPSSAVETGILASLVAEAAAGRDESPAAVAEVSERTLSRVERILARRRAAARRLAEAISKRYESVLPAHDGAPWLVRIGPDPTAATTAPEPEQDPDPEPAPAGDAEIPGLGPVAPEVARIVRSAQEDLESRLRAAGASESSIEIRKRALARRVAAALGAELAEEPGSEEAREKDSDRSEPSEDDSLAHSDPERSR